MWQAACESEKLEEEFNVMAETTQMTAAYLGEHNSTMDKVTMHTTQPFILMIPHSGLMVDATCSSLIMAML